MTTLETEGRATRRDLPVGFLKPRSRPAETALLWVMKGAAWISILITIGIVIALLIPSIEFFVNVPLTDFLFGSRWAPRFANASFGVLPLVTATLWTTAIALLTAVPLGLGAAIYLSEYAPWRVRQVLKPVLEILAGIPTVVYGLFALTFIQATVLRGWLNLETGAFSVLAAGLVMGVMIVPTIASVSEDALSAVPNALRQGSSALGANRMQTTLRVVFPAALSGIAAAIILGVSRAVGETMIVAIAAGSGPNFTFNPLKAAETMTGYIARISGGDLGYDTPDYNSIFAIGLLLFIITLVLNMISRKISKKYREVYE